MRSESSRARDTISAKSVAATHRKIAPSMRTLATVFGAIFLLCSWLAPVTPAEQSTAQRADALAKYRFDPSTPLESRISETPATVFKMFKDLGATPTAHILTAVERQKVSRAFAVLPPLSQRILRERLRSFSFLDGMPNTALTSTVNPDESYKLFDVTIRAGILTQNVSEFLTQKERTCFDTTNSSLNVFIQGGTLDAIVYILLHEATHIVDGSLLIATESGLGDRPEKSSGLFTKDVWSGRTTYAPQYQNTLLDSLIFRAGGKVLGIDQAEAVYEALSRTPFVSVYGSNNWHDDLAEVVAWYHLTEKLKQPYRIEIRNKGKVIFVYEPMKSRLVRTRFDQIKRFYASEQ